MQGTIQKQHNVTATQAMYLMSLPQAFFTLCASLLFETDWASRLGDAKPVDDLWRHEYSTQEVVVLLVTCGCAVFLNYSTIALIGYAQRPAHCARARARSVVCASLHAVRCRALPRCAVLARALQKDERRGYPVCKPAEDGARRHGWRHVFWGCAERVTLAHVHA
ncbi:hypothetical protein EON67_04300, partial [archaeon]